MTAYQQPQTRTRATPKQVLIDSIPAVLIILKGARDRIASRYSDKTCQCCREDERGGCNKPYPDADGQRTWCPLCAVEAEQVNRRFAPTLYGDALAEIAYDVCKRRFAASDWVARDTVLFSWMERKSQAGILAVFDSAIRRLGAA